VTTPKRVLIVDDETKILFIFRRALALLGPECHIETLSTGAEALEAARHTHFDLVIADFGMPDMDGIALTEALRALPQDPIVVWMNACDCGVTREDAQRLGVYRCLDKPLEVADIRRVVSGALWDAPQSAYTPAVQLIKRD
jgi:CheY-like chemotaxis protein